jgi:hypothetical protein
MAILGLAEGDGKQIPKYGYPPVTHPPFRPYHGLTTKKKSKECDAMITRREERKRREKFCGDSRLRSSSRDSLL